MRKASFGSALALTLLAWNTAFSARAPQSAGTQSIDLAERPRKAEFAP
jgi:hypothetical protein